jgi:hypothetical protein
MARKKNYVSKRSVRSLRTPLNAAEVKDAECVSQQINNSALPVKRAVWVLPDYGGCYELYEGDEYLRFWIVNLDGAVPKEYQQTPPALIPIETYKKQQYEKAKAGMILPKKGKK